MPLCSLLRRLVPLLAAGATLVPLQAQWTTLPYSPARPLVTENWFVAHDTLTGIQALSAIAQTWNTVSPAGSTIVHSGDSVLVTEEAGSVLRGWSAYTNRSSSQAFLGPHGSQVGTHQGTSYCIVKDDAPGTNGILRAYSAYTNTWSSLSLPSVPTSPLVWGRNVAVQREGLNYHAYSPYSGQWVTLSVPVAAGVPFVGLDYVGVDLHGTTGPLQYAGFSAIRSVWSNSPTYETSGAALVSAPNTAAFAVRVPHPFLAGVCRYCGYSPYSGQWVTSGLSHGTSVTTPAIARGNIVRILDTVSVEVFGAPRGAWTTQTGSSLVEVSLNDDYSLVTSTSSNQTQVFFLSGMAVGGNAGSIPVPGPGANFGFSAGTHGVVVYGGTDQFTSQAWGYSALNNAVDGPVPFPMASGFSVATSGYVFAINVKGSLAAGTIAHAFNARTGLWYNGPAVNATPSWDSVAGNSTAGVRQTTILGASLSVFDEHSNQWLAARNESSYAIGDNAVLSFTPNSGSIAAYSAQQGTWATQNGIGAITNNGGQPQVLENLAWCTDATHLYVFCTPDRTQTWWQYPAGNALAYSGPTAGGATPYLGVSVRGNPGTDLVFVYTNFTLAPSPLTIPGTIGTLDLQNPGAFQLAFPGVMGPSGIAEVRLPIGGVLPQGLPLWMQGILFDLTTSQVLLAGRATGVKFL